MLVFGLVNANTAGRPSNNSAGCSLCSDREMFKQITKKTIKDEILRKLGFSTAPNVTRKHLSKMHFVRKQIEELERASDRGMQNDQIPGFNMQLDEDDYHFQPHSISILPSDAPFPIRGYSLLYFKLNDRIIDAKHDLVKAVLNVHLPPAPSRSETHARIHVYYVALDKKSGKTFLSKAKENKVELLLDAGGWVDINLLHLTRIWLNHPEENLGVVVKVQVNKNNQKELEIGQLGTELAPYMQIDIHDGAWRSRSKRTTNRVCSEEYDPDVTQCCMWPLTIDFDEFGWEWVLFPRNYDANFCSGDCSLGVVSEYPHTNLMQMSTTGLHSSAGPCCAPRKMSSINMLYLDQDSNVILGKLPSMKVERCGCS